MEYDLVIRNGRVITSQGEISADIGIIGEHIAAIEKGLHAVKDIDATGMLVLPGGIDPHVHLQMPVGETSSSDDWFTGTRAAVCGGTTTVIDFVEPAPGESLQDALEKRKTEAKEKTVADYGLHMTITNADAETLNQIDGILNAGVTSFKTYFTYEGFKLSDAEFLQVLTAVRKAGGIVLVHAENDAAIAYLKNELVSGGKTEPAYHAVSRPAVTEVEAVTRALALAEVTRANLYLVHLSTAGAIQAVRAAQQRGVHAFAETCPQYLLLDERELLRLDFEGAKFVCSPPLRNAFEQPEIWEGLADGTVSTVGTDHCPFFFKGQKELGRDSFTKIPGGLPGIESRLALLHTFGVQTGKLSLQRWVEVCATLPARVFGLYPQKGALQAGSDADIVVFDPERKVQLTHTMLHENVDYTPYEGHQLTGYPHITITRGKVVFQDGSFTGTAGSGRFLIRQKGDYVS
jgi:dihydropyrimidinase